MRVGKDDAVRGRQPGEVVAALDELVRALAIRHAVFRHRLVKRHQRTAAAVGEQHHLGDAGLPAQELDAGLDVERQLFEVDQDFVVLVAGIHAQHQESASRQFRAGPVREIVRRPMHHQDADMRRGTGIGLVERGLAYARHRDEFGMALRRGGMGRKAERESTGYCYGAQHRNPPSILSALQTLAA